MNTPIYAAHDGEVIVAGIDGDGGKCVEIITSNDGAGYKTIYYHLNRFNCDVGDKVKAGQMIAWSGNSGKYTTGPHLHFGLKLTINGVTQNKDNGYNGCVNPELYLPKDYSKSRAYKCYGVKRNLQAEFCFRFAPKNIRNRWADSGRYIQSVGKRIGLVLPLSTERTNMLLYGGWDLSAVADPAMYQICAWYKKDEYIKMIK